MPGIIPSLTLIATIGAGLIAGAFFAFSSFIMRALGNVAPREGIVSMQRINIDVITPSFMAPFIGTVLFCIVLGGWSAFNWTSHISPWLLAGSLLYVIGVFGLTMAFNVPLNNALAAARPESLEGSELWVNYLKDWTTWNTVRTLASLASMVCFAIAYRLGNH